MTRFLPSGDTALVVEFGNEVDRRVNAEVMALDARLGQARIPGVAESVPTFRSLTVHYDPMRIGHRALKQRIEGLLEGLAVEAGPARGWTIPVCYGGEFGPDLDEVAARTGLTAEQVVAAHGAETYRVYMIGFLPGFPYLGDLPKQLALPRRENPRPKVPKGSVCIAMAMTGIYTLESPGGWHLLGRTPVAFWNPARDPPALLGPGDRVRFTRIAPREYETLARRAEAGTLALEPDRAAS